MNTSSIKKSDEKSKVFKFRKFPIPINPVIRTVLQGIYSGQSLLGWRSNANGNLSYNYETRMGKIILNCTHPNYNLILQNRANSMYYAPNLRFVNLGFLRNMVRDFSVETADVFLIIMGKIAELHDPQNDIAEISLRDIADFRGVHIRNGSTDNLYEDFRNEINALSKLRVKIDCKTYLKQQERFHEENGCKLFEVIKKDYKHSIEKWNSIQLRCGLAISHFLNRAGLRWIGYYSNDLLQLSPYHKSFTKKLGTYWTILSVVSGKKGEHPKATPNSILKFCGEEINRRNPGQNVDSFIEAHEDLLEIGLIEEMPVLEPCSRMKGYFKEWLKTPLRIRISDELWSISENKKFLLKRKRKKFKARSKYFLSSLTFPQSPDDIERNQYLIKQFRSKYCLKQIELAEALGVTRQTLSLYERGENNLPRDKSLLLFEIWRKVHSK